MVHQSDLHRLDLSRLELVLKEIEQIKNNRQDNESVKQEMRTKLNGILSTMRS